MPPIDEFSERLKKDASQWKQQVLNLTPEVLIAFVAGSATTIAASRLYVRYLRRIKNHDWITPDVIEKKRWFKGYVTSVGDGDNFRFYHTPGIGWRWPLKFRRIPETNKELKDQTIHIRIAGVDAPECGHFGRQGQLHAEESLAWLRERITGKTIYCQLLQRDQYSRIIAHVSVKRRFLPGSLLANSLAAEMLRAGVATVYEQAGAQYGPGGKEEFLRIEAEAKAARRGMWKKGLSGETPAEYKRRNAQLEAEKEQAAKEKAREQPVQPSKGLFSRLFSR
ncbi:mitochondrial protein [Moniliophthora roreri]|uniref:TNase-like domain-containing protein n=1 Tax=Moniliophthora roreri TaxID=221103 RepID=A0A0W0GEB9_MONRR|nr:mitochondrial protein [Moniliophthora roreri]